MIGLVLALLTYLALSIRRLVAALRSAVPRGAARIAYSGIPLLFFVVAALETSPRAFFPGVLIMAAYLFVPAALQALRPARRPRLDVIDLATILIVWFPIEFGLLPNVRPAGLPLPQLLAVINGLLIYIVIAPFEPHRDAPHRGTPGYTFALRLSDIGTAFGALAAYSVIGLPLGLLAGFLRVDPQPLDAGRWAMMLIGGYLFTALPEELFFRSIIQNKIERRFPRQPVLTLVAASIIFGLTHLNNTTPGFDPPNFMYALMATFAGLAYGFVWRRTGKITASAITHALVNFVWGILLGS